MDLFCGFGNPNNKMWRSTDPPQRGNEYCLEECNSLYQAAPVVHLAIVMDEALSFIKSSKKRSQSCSVSASFTKICSAVLGSINKNQENS